MSCFELDGSDHAERSVSALSVMKDLEVFEDGVGGLDSCVPSVAVEELDLHPAPSHCSNRAAPAVCASEEGRTARYVPCNGCAVP